MDFKSATMEHKTRVAIKMSALAREITRRGNVHDNSKFKTPEVEIYSAHFNELNNAKYGSPEYDKALNNIKPALNHHNEVNDHHVQHFEDGIFGMDLIQILEMLCDISVAAESKGDDIIDTLPTWMSRNGVPENYYMILKNTLEHIKEL